MHSESSGPIIPILKSSSYFKFWMQTKTVNWVLDSKCFLLISKDWVEFSGIVRLLEMRIKERSSYANWWERKFPALFASDWAKRGTQFIRSEWVELCIIHSSHFSWFGYMVDLIIVINVILTLGFFFAGKSQKISKFELTFSRHRITTGNHFFYHLFGGSCSQDLCIWTQRLY